MSVTFSNGGITIQVTSTQAQNVGDVLTLPGGLAIVMDSCSAAGVLIAARKRDVVLGLPKDTLVAVTQGDKIFYDQITSTFTTRPTGYFAGQAVASQLIADTTVGVDFEPVGAAKTTAAISAKPAVFTGNAEAVIASLSLPANLPLRSRIKVEATFRATGQNSTDTFQGRIRIGGLTGTVVADTTALQMANNAVGFLRAILVVDTIGATGVLEGYGEGGAAASHNAAVTAGTVASVALNAPVACALTGVFSSASAGDTMQVTDFRIVRDD